MVSHGRRRGMGLALVSPPPSDGHLPSSPTTMLPPSSPITQVSSSSRMARKEKRKPVLTPRKFKRFFTPRSQLAAQDAGREVLGDASDSALNVHTTPSSATKDMIPEMISPIPEKEFLFSSPSRGVESRKRKRGAERIELNSHGVSGTEDSVRYGQYAGRRRDFAGDHSHLDERADRRMSAMLSKDEGSVQIQPPLSPDAMSISSSEDATDINSLPPLLGRRLFTEPSPSPVVTSLFSEPRQKSSMVKPDYFKSQRSGVPRIRDKKTMTTAMPSHPAPETTPINTFTPKPIFKLRHRGLGAQLLLREQGITPRPGRQHLAYPEHNPFAATSKFFSRKTDWFPCASHIDGGTTIPFSLASCHSASLTAIGDEDGFIRLFHTEASDASAEPDPNKIRSVIHAHDNAIMDLAFSSDDLRLATACGDRNGRIIDVMTQRVAAELNNGHLKSMRRVRFQPGPGNGNILTTSDKDGRIQTWDLRCSSSAPVSQFFSASTTEGYRRSGPFASPLQGKIVNTFEESHTRISTNETKTCSVTALEFLSGGREHLLLSASEGDARIKLWDTRYVTPRSKLQATPLAVTDAPEEHRWRDYGITSLAVSSDTSRFYAVCKDSSIYAYSTAHLIQGSAPELTTKPPRQRAGEAKRGLGPLYALRHDQLEVSSFYVRCALRKHHMGHGPELLAVGSSTGSPILFPTDEHSMREAWDRNSNLPTTQANTTYPFIREHDTNSDNSRERVTSPPSASSHTPTVNNGTALVNGHVREATGVSWAHDGKLVSISDDNTMRHWQEEPVFGAENHHDVPLDARDLRTCGNGTAKRYGAGWASLPSKTGGEKEEGNGKGSAAYCFDMEDDISPYSMGVSFQDDGEPMDYDEE